MKSYPPENWKALGDWVSVERHKGGYSDMSEWAKKVGRSTRMLRGLERGESVGAKTIEAIADALGIANWALFAVLDRKTTDAMLTGYPEVEAARATYEAETGLPADVDAVSLLTYVPDEELLAELSRRLVTRRLTPVERRMAGAAGSWDNLDARDRRALQELGQGKVRDQQNQRAADDVTPDEESESGTA